MTCGLPLKSTIRREKHLRNANQNKITRRAGYKKVYNPPPSPRKHSELKEPDQTLDKTKTVTITARQKKAKEKALKRTSQTRKEPYKNTLKRTEPTKCQKEQ